jgi:hypothetical protein
LIAGVEVQVDDLDGPTLAHVLPPLLLAARGLSRELAAGRWHPYPVRPIRACVPAPAGAEQADTVPARVLARHG